MALDDQLRDRIEAVLRAYALPDLESHIPSHIDRLTHLAKIAALVEMEPPLRTLRKRGERGPSTLALQAFLEGLCAVYVDLTGRQPTRSKKRGGFYLFVEDVAKAVRLPGGEHIFAYQVQLACKKYKNRKFIFSSQ